MGEISAKSSLSPSRRNHSKESRWTLIRLGMGATSVIRANECRAAPSARARETGRASASAMGLLTPPLFAATTRQENETTSGTGQSGCAAGRRGSEGFTQGQLELEVYVSCETPVHKAHKPPQL